MFLAMAQSPTLESILPYGRQSLDESDVDAVVEVLRGDWLTTGPMVDAFERAFYQGESHRRIARELGEARTTVDNWIHVLVLRLAREVAEHER